MAPAGDEDCKPAWPVTKNVVAFHFPAREVGQAACMRKATGAAKVIRATFAVGWPGAGFELPRHAREPHYLPAGHEPRFVYRALRKKSID